MIYSKQEVFDIFVNEILNKETVNILGFNFNTNYNYKINELKKIQSYQNSVINIKDTEKFKELIYNYVTEYVNSSHEYCKPENYLDDEFAKPQNKVKFALTFLFADASFNDYENVNAYILKRTAFLKNNLSKQFGNWQYVSDFENVNNARIFIRVSQNSYGNETPERFEVKVATINQFGQTEEVLLPSINFGIYNNTAYIYSIHNLKQSKNHSEQLNAKLNRARFKINKNVPQEDLDVEPYSLISASLLCGFLNSININKINVINFLPTRYYAKEQAFINKAKNNSEILEELQNKQQLIQENITNKFTKTFFRLQNSNIVSLYNDINPTEITFKVSNEITPSDFLTKLYYNASYLNNNLTK